MNTLSVNGPPRVFVYGSLMRGQFNHFVVEPFVLDVKSGVLRGYHLLDLGAFPGVRPGAIDNIGVRGQILTLKSAVTALALLDRLEGAPYLYFRKEVEVESDTGSREVAWVYALSTSRPKCSVVLSGDWTEKKRLDSTMSPH